MKEQKTLRIDQLENWCLSLASQLKPKSVVLLDGPLGAGKTHLVNEIVKALGGESTSSPSY